jgi:cytochrome c2
MNSIRAVRFDFVILLSIASAGCSNASSDAERGRKLAQQYQCGTCHKIPGVNAANGTVAVTLESFGLRSYIAGRVPNTDENLARWLIDPAAVVPGTLMPNMGVTPGDARDIAAYLRRLR